jgi:hypothetical protein
VNISLWGGDGVVVEWLVVVSACVFWLCGLVVPAEMGAVKKRVAKPGHWLNLLMPGLMAGVFV